MGTITKEWIPIIYKEISNGTCWAPNISAFGLVGPLKFFLGNNLVLKSIIPYQHLHSPLLLMTNKVHDCSQAMTLDCIIC